MVSWNCKNGGFVKGVRLVKLIHIIFFLAESINNITEVVEKRRLFGKRSIIDLIDHMVGNVLLCTWVVRRSRIANHVKDDLSGLLYSCGTIGQNVGQIHSIRRVLALLIPVMKTAAHTERLVRADGSYAMSELRGRRGRATGRCKEK